VFRIIKNHLLSSMSRLKTFCILPLGVVSKKLIGELMILQRNVLCNVVEAFIVANIMTKPRIKLVNNIPAMQAPYMFR